MERKQLVREAKAAALARMEDAARTVGDFQAVVEQWDTLDENRERRQRDHEKKRNEEILGLGYRDGRLIFPIPFIHPAWREEIMGDFLDVIFDSPGDIWQLVVDGDVSNLLKALTGKQKEVLFLSAVRCCNSRQIACYKDQTERAVRKLLAAALEVIRDKLALLIRAQIDAGWPPMTLAKRQFLDWYEKEKAALDSGGDE